MKFSFRTLREISHLIFIAAATWVGSDAAVAQPAAGILPMATPPAAMQGAIAELTMQRQAVEASRNRDWLPTPPAAMFNDPAPAIRHDAGGNQGGSN